MALSAESLVALMSLAEDYSAAVAATVPGTNRESVRD